MAEDLNEVHQAIGELRASTRLTEDRLTRFEASVWQVLTRMESKLDAMRDSLSAGAGGSRMARWLFGAVVALLTAAGTIAGMLSVHFAVSFK